MIGSNIALSTAGQLALVGSLSPDITTLTGGNAIGIQPAVNANNTQTGGLLNLSAGNETGTAGIGGSVSINAGSGATKGTVKI